jgi:hypothetical protein
MFCINCGSQIKDGALFCANCGQAVTPIKTTSAIVTPNSIPLSERESANITDPKDDLASSTMDDITTRGRAAGQAKTVTPQNIPPPPIQPMPINTSTRYSRMAILSFALSVLGLLLSVLVIFRYEIFNPLPYGKVPYAVFRFVGRFLSLFIFHENLFRIIAVILAITSIIIGLFAGHKKKNGLTLVGVIISIVACFLSIIPLLIDIF